MRRSWLLGLLLALVTTAIVSALIDSEVFGTGAENVGGSGPERTATAQPQPQPQPQPPEPGAGAGAAQL